MKQNQWYWVATTEQRHNNWVLYREIPLPVHLRPRYHFLACTECGKVNEEVALRSGIDKDVRLRSSFDVLRSDDGVMCFSQKAKEVFLENGIWGLEFLPLPTTNRREYQIALPTVESPVDRSKAHFQYENYEGQPELSNSEIFCSLCHRPRRGSYIGPLLDSMTLPVDPLCITTPSIPIESWRSKDFWFLISDVVREIAREAKLSGLGISKAS